MAANDRTRCIAALRDVNSNGCKGSIAPPDDRSQPRAEWRLMPLRDRTINAKLGEGRSTDALDSIALTARWSYRC